MEKDFPEITRQYLNSDKIKEKTNWSPKTSFEDGLDMTIDFYK